MIKNESIEIFEKLGGTCCPTCGTRQAHVHFGWLKLSKDAAGKIVPEVLFTQVNCEKCKDVSMIIRFKKEQPEEVYKELDAAITKVFEKRQ